MPASSSPGPDRRAIRASAEPDLERPNPETPPENREEPFAGATLGTLLGGIAGGVVGGPAGAVAGGALGAAGGAMMGDEAREQADAHRRRRIPHHHRRRKTLRSGTGASVAPDYAIAADDGSDGRHDEVAR